MTVEEVLDLTEGKNLIIARGNVFIQTRDEVELEAWRKLGCRTIPWYSQEELDRRAARGRPTWMGWEIHLVGACEEEWESDGEDDEVNVTPAKLLAAARARMR